MSEQFYYVHLKFVPKIVILTGAILCQREVIVEVSKRLVRLRQLEGAGENGYLDRNGMGFIDPKSIKIKLLKPDLALALTWWSVSFPICKQKVVGNTTMNLQKFDNGWKIIASHTSIAAM